MDTRACPRCGDTTGYRVWEAIDLGERPDLRSALASGEWLTVRCERCGSQRDRRHPLLVLHLSPEAPVVLAVPDEALAADDPFAGYWDLITDTYEALGDRRHELPGPVMAAPFDVVAIAAARDVTADVTSRRRPRGRALEAAEARRRYRVFLDMLRDSRSERRINLALNRLAMLSSVDELRGAFAELPELTGSGVRDRLAEDVAEAGDEQERLIATARAELVRAAADGRFDEAWPSYEEQLATLAREHVGPQLITLLEQLRAGQDGEARHAIALGEELLGLFQYGWERSGAHVEALQRTAAAYYSADGPDMEDRLDRVIALCQRAIEIIDAGVEDPEERDAMGDERVRALLNMGAAYSRRYRGDPVANHDRACQLAREVLGEVSRESDPRVWAMASTNLGMSLMHRARMRDPDDSARQREIDEALDRFADALQVRSFEADPLDWAFTETGLGLAYGHRRGDDLRADVLAAIDHHRQAARGMRAAGESALEAQAWHNVASETLALARLDDTSDAERAELTSAAIEACRQALALRPAAVDPTGAGQTESVLGDALEIAGDADGALAARSRALVSLRPDTAPHAARDEAFKLAEQAAEAGDWKAAARAYELAVEAAVVALESRTDTSGRFEELGSRLNLFRWAAAGLLRARQVRRAVEVMELGRGRELAAWLHRDAEADELRALDPQLHARYVAVRADVEGYEQVLRAGMGGDLAAAAAAREAYRQTIDAIRALPGLERFLLAPRYADIASAIPAGETLVYLLSAPSGSAALIVTRDADPEVVDVPALTSGRVVRALIRGNEHLGPVEGYLPAQARASGDLDDAIAEVSALLAPELIAPVAQRLDRLGVHTICLIATGLLGLLPLHALGWEENGRSTCLVERFDVVMAPSALARDVCRRRAAQRPVSAPVLAVGNPLPQSQPLAWAEPEAKMVASLLGAPDTTLLTETAATATAVAAALPSAALAHFACHGSAAVSPQALDSSLYFANDEPLTGADLLELGPLAARLVVASACETGIGPGYETVDEALSLSTVLLGAGAAGAIASLWAVDDLATALLMSRFYEELVAGATPATALRVAMLWLRDLDPQQAAAYARERPTLRDYHDRTDALLRSATHSGVQRPFHAPSLWAAFVLSGA